VSIAIYVDFYHNLIFDNLGKFGNAVSVIQLDLARVEHVGAD